MILRNIYSSHVCHNVADAHQEVGFFVLRPPIWGDFVYGEYMPWRKKLKRSGPFEKVLADAQKGHKRFMQIWDAEYRRAINGDVNKNRIVMTMELLMKADGDVIRAERALYEKDENTTNKKEFKNW